MYEDAEKELKDLINERQPIGAKCAGYVGLSCFYPYLGKYKEAMRTGDKSIELFRQIKDTSYADLMLMLKAITMYRGWKNIGDAWKEAEKTFPDENKITYSNYLGRLSLLQVDHGDYEQAESLRANVSWHVCILSMIESAKRNCAAAEVFADSALKISQQFEQIFVLYRLAECQYNAGYADKAILSLKKLQPLHDLDNLVGARAMNYPQSFYLLGKSYEKKGDRKKAVENYKTFLNLWKNADKDLPDYIDAKKQLTKLEATAAK